MDLDRERQSDRAWEELHSEFECNVDYDWDAEDLDQFIEKLASDYNFMPKDVREFLEDDLKQIP